ncbi:MAG TPA: hypothetical protein VHV31_10690, partial [Nitrolancea sp.]|nr:hypothetical protein [Nitrolancea sp.]
MPVQDLHTRHDVERLVVVEARQSIVIKAKRAKHDDREQRYANGDERAALTPNPSPVSNGRGETKDEALERSSSSSLVR